MSLPNGRQRRKLIPAFNHLESRRLLTLSVQWLGQGGVDLVGPNSNVGPDSIQDIHLHLSGLQSVADSIQVKSIVIQGPSGFEWEYNNFNGTSSGWANAEFFFPSNNPQDRSQGDLYLNPKINSNLDSSGNPIGSSTGASISLQNGNNLALTVTYSNNNTDTGSTSVTSLANPPLSMAGTSTPNNIVLNTYPVSWSQFSNNGQDGTSIQGYVHLSVSNLGGKHISSATLSDQMGANWANPDSTGGHETLIVNDPTGSNTADLYFPPVRDETKSVPGVSTSTDMELRLNFSGDNSQYVSQFAGGPWNTSLVATPLNGNTLSATASTLPAALEHQSGTTEYDTINLPANSTITLTQPLEINHSVHIVGQNTTIKFQASWSSTVPGAIYLDSSLGYNSDLLINIQGVNIQFDTSFSNTWYDPENEANGPHAVLNLHNVNNPPVVLNLSGVSITGPPALDTTPSTPVPSGHVYAGEPATPLILSQANFGWTQSSGSITNSCTFVGGPIELAGGPWTITNNYHNGVNANTYGAAAFSFEGVHDLVLDNNIVNQVASTGTEFRLVNIHGGDFNDDVSGNQFTGGQIGNELTYSKNNSSYNGINDPEIILTESYNVSYEGMVGAVSADRWLISLPVPSASVNFRGVSAGGPGSVISILNTNNSNGTPNTNVGHWFQVVQQISSSPPTFLLQTPFPSGSYAISVASGFVNDHYDSNTINITNKSSTGIKLPGNQFGVEIKLNTITGGTTYNYPYTGTAIVVSAAGSNPDPAYQQNTDDPPSGYPFYMPLYWTEAPSFGITIDSNTIINSPGGMTISVPNDLRETATGREYLGATVTSNRFQWTSGWLAAWGVSPATTNSTFYGILNGSNNPANAPSDNSRPPTITVGDGSSANGGARTPWTVGGYSGYIDPRLLSLSISGNSASILGTGGSVQTVAEPTGQVYAGVINGSVAPSSSFPFNNPNYHPVGSPANYAPYDADNLNINALPSLPGNLGSYYNAVGITTAGSGTQGNADSGHDSLSSSALGSTVSWGGQTFTLGPANTNDIVQAGGQSLSISPGSYTSLYVLAMATGYGQTMGGVYRVDYTDGSYDQYTLGVSDWMNGYTGTGGTTAPGESIAETMLSYNTWNGTQDVSTGGTVYVYGLVIPVDPGRTIQDLSLPNNNNIKILALNAVAQPPQVNLGSYYNAVGITTAGSGTQGNADSGHDSLSSSALGSTVSWGGQTFTLGPANANDIVQAGGQSLSISPGSYTSLYVLAMATGYGQTMGGVYRVDYTDGSYDQYTLGVSDWMNGYTGTGGTTAPGESIAETMLSYNTWNGTQDVSVVGPVYVYAYGLVIPVDPGRTIQDLSLPNNNNIKILALNAVKLTPQVSLGSAFDHTSSNNTSIPFNGVGISEDDNYGAANINATTISLSNAALGNAANWASGTTNLWNGQTFTLGPASVNDVVLVGGQNIPVPHGNYTNFMLLAASVRGPQAATFTVYYTDGSSSTFNQTISDILSGYTGAGTVAPGESIAVAMPYYNNTSSGPQHGTNAYLYGYSFALNPAKTVSSISLNNNNNMALFAIDLVARTQLVDVATGGTASDSGSDNASGGEGAAQAFDGSSATKWLTFANTGWIQYQFGGGYGYVVTQYSLTAGADTSTYPGRAPKNWTFLASNDGVNWTTLDTQTNQADTVSGDTRTYSIVNSTSYKYYRLNITASNGDNIIQLAELGLLA